ncbi:MAG: InlB B-repeat-containing protein [Mogibacterium sp.]|nr:InlB B-repeat-containing protein [Mogibacterium sp.]
MKNLYYSKIKRTLAGLLLAMLAIIMALTAQGMSVYAEDDIPESGVRYTLTYPDGTVVTENAEGEPLSYNDVQELLKPAGWKKMASGLVSDADGKVELNAAWKEGTIRIVETKVPAGYTQGDESEKTAELEDDSVEFVNPKEKEPEPTPSDVYEITYDLNGGEYDGSTEDIVEYYKEGEVISIHEAPERKGYEFDYWKGSEYQPGDSYTVTEDHTFTAQWIKETTTTTTTTTSGGTKTGDGNNMTLYILIGGAAAAIFSFLAFKKKKVRAGVISMMLIGVFAIGTAYAADGFVINKIDDSGEPVEGAVFDIYGKPEVAWEKVLETIDVYGTKTWNFGQGLDPEAISYPVKLTVTLQQQTSSGWETVSGAEPFEVEYAKDDNEFSPGAPGEYDDSTQITEEYRWTVPKYDSNNQLINYRVVENETELAAKGFTQQASSPVRDADGNIEHNLENRFSADSTDSFNISVSMNYENGYPTEWGTGLGWGGIVKGSQTVTITNAVTSESKTLTFTPVKGGGTSAPQTVQLEAGTYTISQTAYALEDLDASADGDGPFAELYLMRTIDQTITVDSSGNCTLSTSGNRPGDSFHAQYYWETVAENPETGDYDIPVFEPDSDRDETGHAGGYNSSCIANDSNITLKTIISNGNPGLSES